MYRPPSPLENVQRVRTTVGAWITHADGSRSRQVMGIDDEADGLEQTNTAITAPSPLPLHDRSLPMAYGRLMVSLHRARGVTETLRVRDAATALAAFAKMARNITAERAIQEIRLRAERKAGELCAALTKLQGTRGRSNKERADGRRTKESQLRAARVTRQQAKIWERLASIPASAFEAAIADGDCSLSTRAVLAAAWTRCRKTAATEIDPAALRLWRRLVAFDDGMLDREPAELLSALTPAMRGTVYSLAPRITAWLDGLPPSPNSRKVRSATGAEQHLNGVSR